MEPLNNGHIGDEQFVHCSEVVPSSEVQMYGQYRAGGEQFVHCREVVHFSECPLLEVLQNLLTLNFTCDSPLSLLYTDTALPHRTLSSHL